MKRGLILFVFFMALNHVNTIDYSELDQRVERFELDLENFKQELE